MHKSRARLQNRLKEKKEDESVDVRAIVQLLQEEPDLNLDREILTSFVKLIQVHPVVRMVLLENNIVPILIKNNRENRYKQLQHELASLASVLCCFNMNDTEEKAAGYFDQYEMDPMLELLVNMLFSEDHVIWALVMPGLKCIYDYHPNLLVPFLNQGLARRLLEIMVKTQNSDILCDLLRWIGNIVYENSQGSMTRLLMNCSLLECLREKLKHPSPQVRQYCLFAISNLIAEEDDADEIIQDILNLKIGRALWLDVFPKENDASVQSELCIIMSNLASLYATNTLILSRLVMEDYLIHGIIRCLKHTLPDSIIEKALEAFETVWDVMKDTDKFKQLATLFQISIAQVPNRFNMTKHHLLDKLKNG